MLVLATTRTSSPKVVSCYDSAVLTAIQYATDDRNLRFWLRLASYFLSDFSRNAYIHILVWRKGAKRHILKKHLLRPFLMQSDSASRKRPFSTDFFSIGFFWSFLSSVESIL